MFDIEVDIESIIMSVEIVSLHCRVLSRDWACFNDYERGSTIQAKINSQVLRAHSQNIDL